MTTLGVIFPPDLPPEQLRSVAVSADGAGVSELWLWEDCFKESGVATAAVVLAWTKTLRVGIGLCPAPLRNVALTAMEVATLARLFPGRLVPGIGHGVQDWMGQVGERVASPMTLLGEYAAALRDLLHGKTVTAAGRYVQLDAVALDWPPQVVPPVLVGAVGPRTLQLAGRLGDGAILTGDTTVEQLATAMTHIHAGAADNPDRPPSEVVVFLPVPGTPAAAEVAADVARYVAAGASTVALLSVGDDAPPLAEFAAFVGKEVQPLVA